jgi:phosphoserine phosphatase RsbU/P
MDMAVNVQASLYPKEVPVTEGWDVAFIFKPMSGVSGDLYDFYIENGQLKGVALFDVSGHGIASGLITMIGRSVFLRNFMSGSSAKLNRVLEQANKDLIKEMGSIDNYLTGILLRITDHAIEYVNAAHPDLLYRNPVSYKVTPINHKDRDFQGAFLGLAGIENQYEDLRFKISKGGTLLLFTDCLIEAKNRSKEMFGEKRLQNAFAKAPDGAAQDILEYILRDYNDFIGDHPVRDDLTVIVLKKTE